MICGVGFGDAVLQLSPPPPGRPSRPPSRTPSNPAVSLPAPSHPRGCAPPVLAIVVGATLVACWSSPQPPAKSWWEPEAATGGRDRGEGGCWERWRWRRRVVPIIGSTPRVYIAAVAASRESSTGARTRPRPPPFSGVSVSGSDIRSQGRGGFSSYLVCPSFSLFLSVCLFIHLTFLPPFSLNPDLVDLLPLASRCPNLARVAELRAVHRPCVRGLYEVLRVSSSSLWSCSSLKSSVISRGCISLVSDQVRAMRSSTVHTSGTTLPDESNYG